MTTITLLITFLSNQSTSVQLVDIDLCSNHLDKELKLLLICLIYRVEEGKVTTLYKCLEPLFLSLDQS